MLYLTQEEALAVLGRNLRETRLLQNISQLAAAERSGISLKAIRNIEEGKNASTLSLLLYCRTLKKIDWIMSLAPPEIDDSLFDRPVGAPKRKRAMPKRAKRKEQ